MFQFIFNSIFDVMLKRIFKESSCFRDISFISIRGGGGRAQSIQKPVSKNFYQVVLLHPLRQRERERRNFKFLLNNGHFVDATNFPTPFRF